MTPRSDTLADPALQGVYYVQTHIYNIYKYICYSRMVYMHLQWSDA